MAARTFVPDPDFDKILIEQFVFLVTQNNDPQSSAEDRDRLNRITRILLERFRTDHYQKRAA